MIEGTYEYACAQLIHWVESMDDDWLEKQAPALREIYAQAKMAQRRAAEHSVERTQSKQAQKASSRVRKNKKVLPA